MGAQCSRRFPLSQPGVGQNMAKLHVASANWTSVYLVSAFLIHSTYIPPPPPPKLLRSETWLKCVINSESRILLVTSNALLSPKMLWHFVVDLCIISSICLICLSVCLPACLPACLSFCLSMQEGTSTSLVFLLHSSVASLHYQTSFIHLFIIMRSPSSPPWTHLFWLDFTAWQICMKQLSGSPLWTFV